MVFVIRRKLVRFLVFLAVVQRAFGQGQIGNSLPCEAPGVDPDPNNDRDNLSCPIQDQSVLSCYSMDEICNGEPFCLGGADEGSTTASLRCGKLFHYYWYMLTCAHTQCILA